jgi:hypothetical protein
MLAFTPQQVHFADTWHAYPTRQRQSDYEVRDTFVPEARAVGYLITKNPERPALSVSQSVFLALATGRRTRARGAIDDFSCPASTKVRAGAGTVWRSARTHKWTSPKRKQRCAPHARSTTKRSTLRQKALRGEPIPLTERRDLRLATSHAMTAAVTTVDAMYTLAGGSSVYDTSDLQRRFRDVHVATQHIMVGPSTLETVGRLLLGVETNTQTL